MRGKDALMIRWEMKMPISRGSKEVVVAEDPVWNLLHRRIFSIISFLELICLHSEVVDLSVYTDTKVSKGDLEVTCSVAKAGTDSISNNKTSTWKKST
jgi:hypothetical protein